MKLNADTFGNIKVLADLKYNFTEPVDRKRGGSAAEVQTGNFSLIGGLASYDMYLTDERIDISVTGVLIKSCLAIRTEVADMLTERNVNVQAQFIDSVES